MRVTAFVTTIGAATFDRCIEALRAQTVEAPIVVLRNMAPFSTALQAMADRCETELYVQVDEDMILHPDALERMVAHVDASPPDSVMTIAPIWDVEVEMAIYGVKAYRRDLVRRVPFVDHPEGDIHDRRRWEEVGLGWSKVWRSQCNCVGLHGTFYTPAEAFARWRRLHQTHRRSGRLSWIEPWPAKLAERYRASGSMRDLYALVGAMVGATEELPEQLGPDFRRPDPVLDRLRALMSPD